MCTFLSIHLGNIFWWRFLTIDALFTMRDMHTFKVFTVWCWRKNLFNYKTSSCFFHQTKEANRYCMTESIICGIRGRFCWYYFWLTLRQGSSNGRPWPECGPSKVFQWALEIHSSRKDQCMKNLSVVQQLPVWNISYLRGCSSSSCCHSCIYAHLAQRQHIKKSIFCY